MALMLIFLGSALSALLVPLVVDQIKSTREQIDRGQAVAAAQAGLDVAVAHVRAATTAGAGVLAGLPCGPLSGSVSTTGTARYEVAVAYLDADPQGHDDTWVAANAITCIAGSGPGHTPSYALLRSKGTASATGPVAGAPGRTLRATYVFRLQGTNTIGGLVRGYGAAAGLCLDAVSTPAVAGTPVRMRTCRSGSGQQRFVYNQNLTIALASSRGTSLPLGLCLDAGATHTAGATVQLQPCSTTTRAQQQWMFNGSANFEGTASGAAGDGFCMVQQSPGANDSFVVLGSTAAGCGAGFSAATSFMPQAALGGGVAGVAAAGVPPASGQVLNAAQFSRCLSVAQDDVRFGYLIAAACGQSSDPSAIGWAQRWSVPTVAAGATSATGRITVTSPGGTYCLRSPASTAAGQYVTVTDCPSGTTTPADLSWTVYADTGTAATRYRVQDGLGYCLAPTDPSANPADLYPGGYSVSKMVVAVCSDSLAQKWNALPGLLGSPLVDLTEG